MLICFKANHGFNLLAIFTKIMAELYYKFNLKLVGKATVTR